LQKTANNKEAKMPIIRSFLDVDFYKSTMGQFAFHRHPEVEVRYGSKNRTKGVRLAEIIDPGQLREELDWTRDNIRANKSELHYLRGTNEYAERMFKEDYLEFLGGLSLTDYYLEVVDGNFVLEFAGPWSKDIYWETMALAIKNELYNQALMKGMSRFSQDLVFAEGKKRLAEKIKKLKVYPEITISDFGTRRRFSFEWQDYVVGVLAQELPGQFLGTSNTYLAMKHGLLPMGTEAHEMDMVYSGIYHESDDDIRASHQKVIKDWWDEYGWGLSVALSDTFGTDFFFRDMSREQAQAWKGIRQDSGNPIAIGEKTIAFYKGHGIDPREKLIVFSDGLDVDRIIEIYKHFKGRIKTTFGWGTNLTNDLGFKPLSIVIKVIEANGHGTVKLSDNLAKAIGKPEDVERFKRIFGYSGTTYEECKY
jgi:nicotinate phosphoribosyltransferase